MTVDCRNDKDIEKNAVGNIKVRKFSFAPMKAKN